MGDRYKTYGGVLVALFVAGLLASGWLRHWQVNLPDPPAIAGHASALYILVTVLAAIMLARAGVPLRGLGFEWPRPTLRTFGIALAGIAALQLAGYVLEPVNEWLFGSDRDLGRFADVADSRAALAGLLLLNWTVAAFGEELAFRVVLMRSIGWVLGGSKLASALALVAQAVVFGLIHYYQGPAGVLGSAVSGIIFGLLVYACRGSLWAAALAHGGNNTIGILQL